MAIYWQYDGVDTIHLSDTYAEDWETYNTSTGGSITTNQTIRSNTKYVVSTQPTRLQNSRFNLSEMFTNFVDLEDVTIDFNFSGTSGITNISKMFYSNSSIKNVTITHMGKPLGSHCNASYMFQDCQSVHELNLNFETTTIDNMTGMFQGCYWLETIDLSHFDTKNVTTMENMFKGCEKITNIDFSSFNTSKVTNMRGMFANCTLLTELDLSYFDTSNVITFGADILDSGMFQNCTHLETIDITNFTIGDEIENVYMIRMFSNCSNLTTIIIKKDSNWSNKTNITQSSNMFDGCTSLVGENGTHYSSSHLDKGYARIDKSGQAGYFTTSRRTISKNVVGEGTFFGDGTYEYGTEVQIVATPDVDSLYYLDKIELTDKLHNEIVTDEDSLNSYTFKIVLTENTTIDVLFGDRSQDYTLSATSLDGYTIQGTGQYKYLDKPTLYINFGGSIVSFEGWFLNDENISTSNPFTFVMPKNNLSLVAKTGGDVFDSLKVRQFVIQNGDGEIYKLTNKNSHLFLNNPTGLGFTKTYSTNRVGNSVIVENELYSMPQISGTIDFYKNTTSDKYEDYYNFLRFKNKKTINIYYKLPTEDDDNIYHIPCEVVSLDKSEVVNGVLECPIVFGATEFWQKESSNVESTSESVQIFNDSDFEIGVDITCRKTNEQPFSNPKIIFKQNDTEVGAIAINISNITKINLNTKDKDQNITLYNEDEIITNPFSYIDFSYADGVKEFPFPKLKQGYNTIEFTYDGMSEGQTNSYTIIYDKGYVSV